MSKIDEYREVLRSLGDWDDYLLRESRLPGPRANLELASAVALEGWEKRFLRWLAEHGPEQAPTDIRESFLAVCGVMGLGYLAARGGVAHFDLLRECAGDPRWRVREAVALGLQQFGKVAPERLLPLMVDWSRGSLLVRRAAVATLCEPSLLVDADHALRILAILDDITALLLDEPDRRAEDFKVLRKGLAYGWSVAVAAQPDLGKPRMERWIGVDDRDIRWLMKQNLRKKRLLRMDAAWVEVQLSVLESR